MRFKSLLPAAFATAVLYVVPGTKAATVNIDLGTILYGTNVNASILNLTFPMDPQTYTYNSLIQGPNSSVLDMVLPNGKTVAQELTALGYGQNDGVLDYNFPFALGASGSYSQNGTPPFSPGTGVGPGLFQSLTAASVAGTVCTGSNSVGATISVDPTNATATYETILGCDSVGVASPGFPTSFTSTGTINLGTFLVGDTSYSYAGEETITTWEVSGEVNVAPVSPVPEPSSLWLAVAGLGPTCAARARKRACIGQ